jgi:hypothetical protein
VRVWEEIGAPAVLPGEVELDRRRRLAVRNAGHGAHRLKAEFAPGWKRPAPSPDHAPPPPPVPIMPTPTGVAFIMVWSATTWVPGLLPETFTRERRSDGGDIGFEEAARPHRATLGTLLAGLLPVARPGRVAVAVLRMRCWQGSVEREDTQRVMVLAEHARLVAEDRGVPWGAAVFGNDTGQTRRGISANFRCNRLFAAAVASRDERDLDRFRLRAGFAAG